MNLVHRSYLKTNIFAYANSESNLPKKRKKGLKRRIKRVIDDGEKRWIIYVSIACKGKQKPSHLSMTMYSSSHSFQTPSKQINPMHFHRPLRCLISCHGIIAKLQACLWDMWTKWRQVSEMLVWFSKEAIISWTPCQQLAVTALTTTKRKTQAHCHCSQI